MKELFAQILAEGLNLTLEIDSFRSVHGGCINQAFHVVCGKDNFFIKINEDKQLQDIFSKEAIGLKSLEQTYAVFVPEVYAHGHINELSYLILQYLPKGEPNEISWQTLGYNLAELHSVRSEKYGFEIDNYIGSLPQSNTWKDDWRSFFIENRLSPQVELAANKGFLTAKHTASFDILYAKLDSLLPHEHMASLIHGDFWSGNYLVSSSGRIHLVDPCPSFSHREAEMAFTKMFGGFDPVFYQAYFDTLPVDPGFDERVEIYNLYNYLVHLNLFGTSYLSGIDPVLNKYG